MRESSGVTFSIRAVAIVIIVAFLCNVMNGYTFSYPEAGQRESGALSPDLSTRPILNQTKGDKLVLTTFLLNKIGKDPLYLSGIDAKTSSVFSDLGEKKIEVVLSTLRPLEVDLTPIVSGGQVDIQTVRCEVNGKCYYSYVIKTDDGRIRTAVHTEEEYKEYTGELFRAGKLSREVFDELIRETSVDGIEIAVVDSTDESVRRVAAFLKGIGAAGLDRLLSGFVSSGKLFLSKKAVLVTGGMVLPYDRDEISRSGAIMEQFLLAVDPTMPPGTVGRFRKAFSAFDPGKKDFDLAAFDVSLKYVVTAIENIVAARGNEGDTLFYPKYMIDVSDVNLSSPECQDVLTDITEIFKHVAEAEIERYGSVSPGGKKISLADMPGSMMKVVIEHLSDSILPTAQARPDGTIALNENFVKIMYKLASIGMRDKEEGAIYDEQPDGTYKNIGNVYESILYSVAIHEIRGHFRIRDGRTELVLDEKWAQGERGRGHLYVNLAAMLYFWFGIVENGERLYETEIKKFMEDYPEIFRNLEDGERERLPVLAERLTLDFGFRGMGAACFRFVDVPTAAAVYRFMGARGAFNVDELVPFGQGMTREAMDRCFSYLRDLGLIMEIKNAMLPGEEVPRYGQVPMAGQQVDGVQEILDGLEMPAVKPDIRKVRGSVYEITEPVWAGSVLEETGKIRDGAIVEDPEEKKIIAIETDWVPDGQANFTGKLIQEIGKFKNIEVIRASSEKLAGKIREAVDSGRVSLKDMVVLASRSTIESPGFNEIRSVSDDDQEKAFCVGIDPVELKDDSYVRLMEMLTMALQLASGKTFIRENDKITVKEVNR
ncbi:MAG: hypothetical protein ABIA77_02410, partial [Candidatus Omnitrophota bacterium]